MEVYDQVNNLARAIKDSKEYKEYKEVKSYLESMPELKKQVDEFEKIRYEEKLYFYGTVPYTCSRFCICSSKGSG